MCTVLTQACTYNFPRKSRRIRLCLSKAEFNFKRIKGYTHNSLILLSAAREIIMRIFWNSNKDTNFKNFSNGKVITLIGFTKRNCKIIWFWNPVKFFGVLFCYFSLRQTIFSETCIIRFNLSRHRNPPKHMKFNCCSIPVEIPQRVSFDRGCCAFDPAIMSFQS